MVAVRQAAGTAGTACKKGTVALSIVAQQVLYRRAVLCVDRPADPGPRGVPATDRPERRRCARRSRRPCSAAARKPVPARTERTGAVLRPGDDPGVDRI